MPDWLFVAWAGGTALLSYSLVYALRKPFTAAEFEGMEVAGMDYKVVVTLGAGFALLFCWGTIWRRRRDVAGIFLAPKA